MKQKKKDDRIHIVVSPETRAKLEKLGKMGDSFEDIIKRLLQK